MTREIGNSLTKGLSNYILFTEDKGGAVERAAWLVQGLEEQAVRLRNRILELRPEVGRPRDPVREWRYGTCQKELGKVEETIKRAKEGRLSPDWKTGRGIWRGEQ